MDIKGALEFNLENSSMEETFIQHIKGPKAFMIIDKIREFLFKIDDNGFVLNKRYEDLTKDELFDMIKKEIYNIANEVL